jgi:hypothetical protein
MISRCHDCPGPAQNGFRRCERCAERHRVRQRVRQKTSLPWRLRLLGGLGTDE